MMYTITRGKFSGFYYQRTKGGTIQKKQLTKDLKAVTNPSRSQLHYRELFSQAVKGKHFASRLEMYQAIRQAIKGD